MGSADPNATLDAPPLEAEPVADATTEAGTARVTRLPPVSPLPAPEPPPTDRRAAEDDLDRIENQQRSRGDLLTLDVLLLAAAFVMTAALVGIALMLVW